MLQELILNVQVKEKLGKRFKRTEKKNPEENSKSLVTYKTHRPIGKNSHKDEQE